MIVLDTHVWIWWVSNPELLSEKARQAIDHAIAENRLCISAMSSWEVAMLVSRKRLELTMDVRDWVAVSESLPFIRFLPVTNLIALKSVKLSNFHNDPADRIIVATALTTGAALVTRDEKILSYQQVKTIW